MSNEVITKMASLRQNYIYKMKHKNKASSYMQHIKQFKYLLISGFSNDFRKISKLEEEKDVTHSNMIS